MKDFITVFVKPIIDGGKVLASELKELKSEVVTPTVIEETKNATSTISVGLVLFIIAIAIGAFINSFIHFFTW